MHTTVARAQNVFGFFTTVAFVIAALIAASDYFSPRTPTAVLSVGSVQTVRGRPHYYSTKKEEYASIRFNLAADFSSLMTWNTKSIYVSVSAVWPTPGSPGNLTNEAVIYDTILISPSADHLSTISTFHHIAKSAKTAMLRKSKKEGKGVEPERGIVKLKNQKPKYTITAPGGKVGGIEDVRLKVRYNVQPWVGALAWEQVSNWGRWKSIEGGMSEAFALPEVKKKRPVESASS